MEKKRDWLLPASIVIAAVLVSGALVYNAGVSDVSKTEENGQVVQNQGPAELIRPVSNNDHIRGAGNPTVIIVEYSDLECPYCKTFHETMQQVMSEYDNQVAWVYRQFPLTSIHPKAVQEAEASECAAELGGNDAFWAYVDGIFKITPSNNGLDLGLLPDIAVGIGLDRNEFQSCLDGGKMAERIDEDMEDVGKLDAWSRQNTGRGIGTPYSVVINNKTGESTVIPGAVPFAQVKSAIDQILNSDK